MVVESIGGANQLCSSLEVITILFLNYCGSQIKLNDLRQLLVVLFTILIVEYFYRFAPWFFPLHWRVSTLNLVFYLIIPTFNSTHYWLLGVILLLGCN